MPKANKIKQGNKTKKNAVTRYFLKHPKKAHKRGLKRKASFSKGKVRRWSSKVNIDYPEAKGAAPLTPREMLSFVLVGR